MLELDVIHIFLTVMSFVAAILVLSVGTLPRRSMRNLRHELLDIDTRIDTLDGRWKKLNANYALLLARAKLLPELVDPDDTAQRQNETPEQWKQRMRAAIRSGKLKVGGTD
jgi:hypothetical protein